MTDKEKKIKNALSRGDDRFGASMDLQQAAQELAEEIHKDIENYVSNTFPYIECTILPDNKKIIEEKEKRVELAAKAADYAYDSICLRIQELVNELALCKAKLDHSKDIEGWRRFYNQRSIRIFMILDDLVGGHSDGVN